jgi:hypothetical protein
VVLATVALTGTAVGLAVAPAAAAGPCVDLAPAAGHPGFANDNVPYTQLSGFQSVTGSHVTMDLVGAGNCDAPGSRFVHARVRLWDATGTVYAYVDQYGVGEIPGTMVAVNPSGFHSPATSNMKNVPGLTVRACGVFHFGSVLEGRCGPWVTVPA